MKILVLGGGSFYGAAFVAVAREAGHEVCATDRRKLPRIDDINEALPGNARDFVEDGFRHVVNFVALAMPGESWDHAPDYYRTNVVGIARLAEELSHAPLERFVQVSTPEVYGRNFARLTEDALHDPSTPYAASRAAGDRHLALLWRQRRFPVCFTRTVNIYGPGQPAYRIVPKAALASLLKRRLPLHGGGTSERSFIHVRDAACATLDVLERGEVGETYHIATRRMTEIRDLVEMICGIARAAALTEIAEEAPDRTGKDPAYILDDAKIRRDLGWSDEIRLEDGLVETVEWVRSNLQTLRTAPVDYVHKP